MKKKVGTVLDEEILLKAKERAAREGRALADLLQEALVAYLYADTGGGDAERACRDFCSHGSDLSRGEIDELLQEDMLVL